MTKAKHSHSSAAAATVAAPESESESGRVTVSAQAHQAPEPLLPLPLWIAFAVVLFAGIIVGATGNTRTASSAMETLTQCNAAVLLEKDGLSDAYGLIHFNSRPNDVVKWLSLCEMERELALGVFRKALSEGNKSAKLIALHSAYYLTSHFTVPGKPESGRPGLSAADFAAILALLSTEKDNDIRRAAQRAISELVVVAGADQKRKAETLPPNLSSENGPNRIESREEKLGKDTYLTLRWSNPDLASAWLAQYEKSSAWDPQLQRLIIKNP